MNKRFVEVEIKTTEYSMQEVLLIFNDEEKTVARLEIDEYKVYIEDEPYDIFIEECEFNEDDEFTKLMYIVEE